MDVVSPLGAAGAGAGTGAGGMSGGTPGQPSGRPKDVWGMGARDATPTSRVGAGPRCLPLRIHSVVQKTPRLPMHVWARLWQNVHSSQPSPVPTPSLLSQSVHSFTVHVESCRILT
jgi:hypothetical protein